jgi:hypothetical protein
LWLRPHRTKLQIVWQGPYEVVDKASEWHHYTIEHEGKRRRATASQLKKFHPSEIGGDTRFAAQERDTNDSEPVSGFFEVEDIPEEIPLTDYSGFEKPCYEAATFPLGEDCEPDSQESGSRTRRPPS